MSSWEQKKEEKRARIVAAAREMIGETGDTTLSMRPLARRAGVSPATPYNLFGTKQVIIEAVLAADVQQFVERVAAVESADAIQRIFDALRLSVDFYRDEPKFYRALFRALFDAGSLDLARTFDPPRRAFWRDRVKEAIADGGLASDIDARLFALALGHVFGALLLDWVEHDIPLARLEAALGYEFALMLAGAATPTHDRELRERAREFQRQLLSFGPEERRTRAPDDTSAELCVPPSDTQQKQAAGDQ